MENSNTIYISFIQNLPVLRCHESLASYGVSARVENDAKNLAVTWIKRLIRSIRRNSRLVGKAWEERRVNPGHYKAATLALCQVVPILLSTL